eukprot:TRINITY_DN14937_c0_g1_i1.p1 TRINITY_DN14937_c0_g1~~TRINITY_DN14937_c0_g1_i1.p1  ORF type:complete len:708 (+),score=245.66 TRINITY_DN14937_c0_g1_i1:102-2225(+)
MDSAAAAWFLSLSGKSSPASSPTSSCVTSPQSSRSPTPALEEEEVVVEEKKKEPTPDYVMWFLGKERKKKTKTGEDVNSEDEYEVEEEPLLLAAPPADFKDEVVAELAGYPYYRQVERAGHCYEKWLNAKIRKNNGLEEEDTDASSSGDEGDDEGDKKFKGHHEKHAAHIDQDHYEILGLGDKRWEATQDDIRRAYRKLILVYHPDKKAATAEDEDEDAATELFRKIQKAFDTLSDDVKRKKYDSTDEFDESVPNASERKQAASSVDNFFAIYLPVFSRNGKWSVTQPVPSLGKKDTPWEDVENFYDFWQGFVSWRDFTHEDSYDVEEADSREEKRWMERQNKNKVKEMKREDVKRIAGLVETAYQCDPRVKRRKIEIELEKQRKKLAKRDAARKRKQDVEDAKNAIKQKKEDEEKLERETSEAAVKARNARNKNLRKKRNRLRSLCKLATFKPEETHIERLCNDASMTQLNTLCKAINADSSPNGPGHESFTSAISDLDGSADKEANKKAETKKAEPQRKGWTEDEINILVKAVARYPGGSLNRWDRINELLPHYSKKEIIAKSHTMRGEAAQKNAVKASKANVAVVPVVDDYEKSKAKAASKPHKPITAPLSKDYVKEAESEKNWSLPQQQQFEKGVRAYNSKVDQRWTKIAALVEGKSKEECIARFKFLVAAMKKKKAAAAAANGTANGTTNGVATNGTAPPAK